MHTYTLTYLQTYVCMCILLMYYGLRPVPVMKTVRDGSGAEGRSITQHVHDTFLKQTFVVRKCLEARLARDF